MPSQECDKSGSGIEGMKMKRGRGGCGEERRSGDERGGASAHACKGL